MDTRARFLFVAPDSEVDVSQKFWATPFDIEGVFRSHRDNCCTFDTKLGEIGLRTAALDRLAKVIFVADANRRDLVPGIEGLLAFSVGLPRRYRDDQIQLETSLLFCDALNRWVRYGTTETHDWPSGGNQ